MNKLLSFFRFACVGGLGFVVDSLCFYLVQELLPNLLLARLLAFVVAVYVTWLGNKHWSFQNRRVDTGVGVYYCLSCCGGAINLAAFFALQFTIGVWPAFVAGVAAGMLFNFFAYRIWVFKL